MAGPVLESALAISLVAAILAGFWRVDRWASGSAARPPRAGGRARRTRRRGRAGRRDRPVRAGIPRALPRRGLGARRFALRRNWARPPAPEHRPVQLVAADLRRLSRELAMVPAGAPFVRWQALRTAYDRLLAEAAELLDVPHELAETPVGTPRDIERLRVVCALEAAGLRVQD